jgi:cysteine desulfurase/selenocysteine lyase
MNSGRRRFLAAFSAAGLLRPVVTRAQTATPPVDPLGVRADFPVADKSLYLDAAYITPNPLPVVEAGRAFAESKAHQPISLGDMLARTDQVRGGFARLIGAQPAEIGFLFSTSEGENIVAQALGLTRGDNIVVDELHYNTSFVLYRHLEATRGVELRIVKARDGGVTAADFAPLVDRRTKIVSVAWVSHQNGFRHDLPPLAELAHRHGAWLYADAVQAVGMFPIDVKASGVDMMTTGTYKWLLGSYGVAPFYVRAELLDRITPDRMGALHVERTLPDFRYEIYKTAKKFDYATLAFGPVYQLGAALQYLDRVGVARIERHTVGLAQQLADGLRGRGVTVLTPAGNQSAIVAFRNPADAARTRTVLEQSRTRVSVRDNGMQIRVSPALYNTSDDVRRFLEVVDELKARK